MPHEPFVHLHLHSEYSLLDGAVRIPALMKKVQQLEMPAVALTDHGNLFGAVDFYKAAKKAKVKPIIGCEIYLAPGSMTEKSGSQRESNSHFTLLAADATGYANLVKLVSAAHLDGMYYKPRIDKDLLSRHSAGLIGLSGCLKGEINQAILADQMAKARQHVGEFREILGPDNFFLEMHDHGIESQRKCNAAMPGLAKEFGLGLVAANDVHFLERSHHEAHDVLICIGTGSNVTDEKRMHYVPELYLKSGEEMLALFPDHPDAIRNTVLIAERCNFEMEFGVTKYPNYEPPAGIDQNAYLRQLSGEGMRKRYGERWNEDPKLNERFEREMGILEKAGYVNYFLITWDFIHWAKKRDIPVGPGRGSAAGSMVAFALGITDIDPLRFDLLFERFLNPERVSPPDIDVDFCVNRRGEVIDYVRQKYGERAVSQIITFGTLGAKSVIRDVARVLGWGYNDADRVAKMIPNELNITLNGHMDKKGEEEEFVKGAIDKNPELKAEVETNPAAQQLWEYATTLEGLTRGSGVHAAGVVIGDRDLSEYIPLTRGNDGEIVSQYAMGPLTDLGMLKMDFLGLKTLTVIHDAVKLIRAKLPGFSIDTIPLDDKATFDMLSRGETIGIFQLESGGMVDLCKKFDVGSIEDLSAILALYRPGPMDLIPEYIKRKKGINKVKLLHPLLEKVCGDTFGIMIYQEQVMAAASVLAGYTLGGADMLRRAMGKKDKKKMEEERAKFVEGCKRVNDIDDKKAAMIFDEIAKFADYGFNKSHSAAYAWVSYQTAYLKSTYPIEFMAAVLSNEINNTDKISVFVGECQRMGIEILPPDVNRSADKFAPETLENLPEKDGALGAIRFGLSGIKNVGEAAMQLAIEERNQGGAFKSLDDFCARMDSRKVNRKVIESLIKSGAFDWTRSDRAELFARVEEVMAAASSEQRDRASGQVSLFDMLEEQPKQAPRKSSVRYIPWSQREKLAFEKELLGFYVTGHPLDEYRGALESGRYLTIEKLREAEDKATVTVAGTFAVVEKKFTKRDGKPFAATVLEDFTGNIEIVFWSEAFTKAAAMMEPGKVVAVTGRLDKRDEVMKISGAEVKLLKPSPKESPVVLMFEESSITETDMLILAETLREFPGQRPVEIEFQRADGCIIRLRAGDGFRVNVGPELKNKLGPRLKGE